MFNVLFYDSDTLICTLFNIQIIQILFAKVSLSCSTVHTHSICIRSHILITNRCMIPTSWSYRATQLKISWTPLENVFPASGVVGWPARAQDFSRFDVSLWEYLKERLSKLTLYLVKCLNKLCNASHIVPDGVLLLTISILQTLFIKREDS